MLIFRQKRQLSIFQMLFSDLWKDYEQFGYMDVYSFMYVCLYIYKHIYFIYNII